MGAMSNSGRSIAAAARSIWRAWFWEGEDIGKGFEAFDLADFQIEIGQIRLKGYHQLEYLMRRHRWLLSTV